MARAEIPSQRSRISPSPTLSLSLSRSLSLSLSLSLPLSLSLSLAASVKLWISEAFSSNFWSLKMGRCATLVVYTRYENFDTCCAFRRTFTLGFIRWWNAKSCEIPPCCSAGEGEEERRVYVFIRISIERCFSAFYERNEGNVRRRNRGTFSLWFSISFVFILICRRYTQVPLETSKLGVG